MSTIRFVNWKIVVVCCMTIILYLIIGKKKSDRCEFSEAYPSYGPGCNIKCENGYGYASSMFNNVTIEWPKDLVINMYKAANILEKFGHVESLDTKRSIWLHVALHYYCCYSKKELIRIQQYLNNYKWSTHDISFDRMVCAISETDKISIVLMADEKIQSNLLTLASTLENDMKSQMNISIRIPRIKLQKIHMTLGMVSRSKFPAQEAVNEINKQILPKTWHIEPILLSKAPVCNKCKKL